MSRTAWFCIPAWGHTNPTVEVVRTLTARSHQVRYYSFTPFRETLEAAGAEVVCCDPFLPPPSKDLERKVGEGFRCPHGDGGGHHPGAGGHRLPGAGRLSSGRDDVRLHVLLG